MLSDGFDVAPWKAAFQRDRRVVIRNLFDPATAEAARQCVATQLPWWLTYTDGRQPLRMSPEELAATGPAARQKLVADVYAVARRGLGFLYNSYFLSDAFLSGDYPDVVAIDIIKYLNSPAFITMIRDITGDDGIYGADAQATQFAPGHFLTRHIDTDPANQRRIAYVIGLSKGWHPDWGGLLQFYHRDGTAETAFAPEFNVISLFEVTRPHAVTMVTPFAGGPRLSITGWFRSDALTGEAGPSAATGG